MNDLHYQTDVAALGDEPPGADVLDAVDTHLTTLYRACLPVGNLLDSLEAREEVMPGSGAVPLSASKVKGVAGTLATPDTKLSDAATLILKLRSDAAIRSARGYLAMPSPKASGNLDATAKWSTVGGFWTAIQAFAAALDDVLSTGGAFPASLNPVVYSRTRRSRGLSPFTFQMVEAIPNPAQRWRRSRTTTP